MRSRVAAIRPSAAAELSIVAYFACAVAIGALASATSVTHAQIASALAFSPADLLAGKLWRLPLSGLVVDGDTWSQLADLIPVALLLVLLADARTFWRAAIGAHVGSTLLAYAVIAVLALADPGALGGLVHAPDYGVSCVWAGCLGALATAAARRGSRPAVSAALFAVCTLPALRLVSSGFVSSSGTLQLAPLEHALAFAIGALAAAAPARGLVTAAARRWPASGRRDRRDGRAGQAPATVPAPSSTPARASARA